MEFLDSFCSALRLVFSSELLLGSLPCSGFKGGILACNWGGSEEDEDEHTDAQSDGPFLRADPLVTVIPILTPHFLRLLYCSTSLISPLSILLDLISVHLPF